MTFKKGKSGNPAGRPKGSKSWTSIKREEMRRDVPDVLKMVYQQAIENQDIAAARLYLDKCIPNMKPSDDPVQINIDPDQPSLSIAKEIMREISTGGLTIDDGAKLINAVAEVSKQDELKQILDVIREKEG